jgi:phage-related minor tail protein
VANLSKLVVEIEGNTAKLSKGLKDAESQTSGFGSKLGAAGKIAAVGLAGVGVAAAGVGVAAFKLGADFDKAYHTIRLGTGATGEALDGLKDDFKKVTAGVPDDFGKVSTAIADLNTRTGLTGPPLQALSKQFLELSRITGGDVSTQIANVTRLFGDWGVEADQQAGTMDMLWRASQNTGIGYDTLSQKLVQFGAPLRMMNFSVEESATLLGKWEKEGVNTELVLGSLRIAAGKFADAGVPMRQGLDDTIAKIQKLGPGAQATSLAMEVFGARAGPDMAAAILEGRFELGQLADDIKSGGETIGKAASDTADAGEKFGAFQNKLKVALEPAASAVFGFANSLADTLIPFLTRAGEVVAGFLPTLGLIADGFKQAFQGGPEALLPLEEALERVFGAEIAGRIVGFVGTAIDGFRRLASLVTDTIVPAFAGFLAGALEVAGNLGRLGQAVVENVTSWSGWPGVIEAARTAIDGLVSGVSAVSGVIAEAARALEPLTSRLAESETAVAAITAALVAGAAAFVAYKVALAIQTTIAAFQAGIAAATAAVAVFNAVLLANPIGLVVVAVAALAAGVVVAYREWDGFRKAIDGVWAFLKGTLYPILQDIGSWLSGSLAPVLREVAGVVADQVIGHFRAWWEILTRVASVIDAVLTWVGRLVSGLGSLGGAVTGALGPLGALITTFGKLKDAASGIKELLHRSLPPLAQGIQDTAAAARAAVPSIDMLAESLDRAAASAATMSTGLASSAGQAAAAAVRVAATAMGSLPPGSKVTDLGGGAIGVLHPDGSTSPLPAITARAAAHTHAGLTAQWIESLNQDLIAASRKVAAQEMEQLANTLNMESPGFGIMDVLLGATTGRTFGKNLQRRTRPHLWEEAERLWVLQNQDRYADLVRRGMRAPEDEVMALLGGVQGPGTIRATESQIVDRLERIEAAIVDLRHRPSVVEIDGRAVAQATYDNLTDYNRGRL